MFRPATSNDLPALLNLLEQLFSIEEDFTFNAEQQMQGLHLLLQAENAHIVVGEINNHIACMATGQLLISTAEGGATLHIEDVVVAPTHQRHGLGGGLLQQIADWGLARGAHRMQLLADKNNIPALEFYTRQKWQTTKLICLRKYNSNES